MDANTGVTSFTSDYDVDTGSRPMSLVCTLTVTDSGGLTDTAELDITISTGLLNYNPIMLHFTSCFFFLFFPS